MKIAIVGSRGFSRLDLVVDFIKKLPSDSIIISGGARGVDRIAEAEAKKRGLDTVIFYPEWDNLNHPDAVIKVNKFGNKYDAKAGMRRNSHIIDAADFVVAFWDKKSSGTLNSINLAKSAGKSVTIITDTDEQQSF